MKQRMLMAIGAGTAAGLLSVGAVQAQEEEVTITVVSWGGAYSESQRRAYLEPYEELNPHINFVTDDSSANGLAGLRAQSQANNVTWDLVDMLPANAQLACFEGLIMEIDHDEMLAPAPDGTPPTEDFVEGSLGPCFVPQIIYSTIVAYNTDMFPEDEQPGSIDDFFNTEDFPGDRAIQDRPRGNLEWALYADGVALEDIYDVLATEEGQDRAFDKLDEIKDNLVFWTEGAQGPQLLADQEVAFTTGYNGRIFNAAQVEGQPFDIIWDGQLVEFDGWVIPAGGDNTEEVLEFVRWATDTQRLADQAKYISYGPARESSAPLVGEHADLGIDMSPHMPTNPDNYFAPIVLDNDFWADYGDELRERYANWMLQ
ncbi:spermidine/putrescine ABC transporter substrate-binding protein [Rhodobacteraceae bacterium WD3A24]|nr:spermidine/putrescine ABC transporter substrate-binding protein [Rhodobacteraceae bacterium WD3A24]